MARRVRKSRADIQRWSQMISSLRLMNFAFTNVRLYPPTHPEVIGTITKLHETINPMVEEQEDIGYGFMDQMLYLEGAMSLEETANNQMLVDRFGKCRVKYLTFMKGIKKEDLIAFFQVLNEEASKPSEESPGEILEKRGITTIHIVEAELDESASKGKMVRKKTLLDWYEKAVNTYAAVFEQFRQAGPVEFKPLFRVIDDMTATIRNKGYEPFLLLPILGRGMDPYACHSVNVGIYCCALGELYGLNSGQINTLCIYALLHDIGRFIVPMEWIQRKDPLTPEERALADQHMVWGSLFLMCKEELAPQAGLLAAYHHQKLFPDSADTGYVPDIYQKILMLADRYDLASGGDKYYWKKHSQDKILKVMLNRRGVQYNETMIKLLANCMGYYPVGSLVRLNDGRRAIVVRPNTAHIARPKVYLFESEPKVPAAPMEEQSSAGIAQPAGMVPEEPPPDILDLTEINESCTGFKFSIVSPLTPPPEMDIQKLLDEKKEYLLSYSY